MSILFLAQVKITKNTSKKCEICIIHIEIFLNHDIIALQSIRFAFIKIKIFIRISNGHSHTSARYDSPAKRIFAFIKIKNFIRISNGHSRTSIQYISPAKHSLCIHQNKKFSSVFQMVIAVLLHGTIALQRESLHSSKQKIFIRISNGHSRASIQYISPAKPLLCIDVTENSILKF